MVPSPHPTSRTLAFLGSEFRDMVRQELGTPIKDQPAVDGANSLA